VFEIYDLSEIDATFNLYEKRYNLTKMATDCGVVEKEFKSLSSKDKFLLLSNKLREANKVNLASFFFGKLFEVSSDFEALLSKIECLIELGEFEEAQRFNNIGWELYLEDDLIDIAGVEKRLEYHKSLIAYYTEKYRQAESYCEENIIKFKSKEFYFLLCADFIALSNMEAAVKFYNKYFSKFGNQFDFLLEVFVLLINVNMLERAIDFVNCIYNITSEQRLIIINYINNYYSLNKNKNVLKKLFEKEVNIIK